MSPEDKVTGYNHVVVLKIVPNDSEEEHRFTMGLSLFIECYSNRTPLVIVSHIYPIIPI